MTTAAEQLAAIPLREIRIERAVVLDWLDGPLEGFLRIVDTDSTWYFQLAAERTRYHTVDDRLYLLFHAPTDALERLAEVLGENEMPTGKLWVPSWSFRDANAQQRAEVVLAGLLDLVGRAQLFLRSSDLLHIEDLWLTADRVTITR